MLVTYHRACDFPGCVHSAVMRERFNWPLATSPQPEIPEGWSLVLRPGPKDDVVVIAVCGKHDFAFDGVKAKDMKPIGFQAQEHGGTEE